MDVVDEEEQSGSRGRHSHELRGGDEEPLVAVLAGPAEVASGERTFDLAAEVITQRVQESRVATAQRVERVKDWGVGPGPLHRRGSAPRHLPTLSSSEGIG